MTIFIPAWVDGTLTPVEKLETHRRGLRHKAVSVFVLWGDKILIQQRALGKYHTPGLWANTCCTHPTWEEAPEDCAIRRLDEELGLKKIALTHRGQVEYRADVGGGLIEHELVDVYVASLAGKPDFTPNPDEVMAVDWVSHAELLDQVASTPEKFTPWLKIYLRDFAEQIFPPT